MPGSQNSAKSADFTQQELPPLVQALLHSTLLTERIRCGELARFDTEFPPVWRLAATCCTLRLQAQLRFVQANRFLAAGDVELGTGFAERGFQTQTNVTATWLEPASFVLESCVIPVTGALADQADQLAAGLAQPRYPSLPQLVAPAAALGFAQGGDTQRARDRLTVFCAAAVMGLDSGDRLLGAGGDKEPKLFSRQRRRAAAESGLSPDSAWRFRLTPSR